MSSSSSYFTNLMQVRQKYDVVEMTGDSKIVNGRKQANMCGDARNAVIICVQTEAG